MKPLFHRALEPDFPVSARLRPNWTTWMWLGFAVCVAVATVVGFVYAAPPYMLR